MQYVDLYDQLKALVPNCEKCGKPLYVIESVHKVEQWGLKFCKERYCNLHCRCSSAITERK